MAYADGAYPMRTVLKRVHQRVPHEAIQDLLPYAAGWPDGHDVDMAPRSLGGSNGLEALAELVFEGLPPNTEAVLINFALRLGARRRADAATTLVTIGEVTAAALLKEQAKAIGAAQYHAVISDDAALVDDLRQLAQLHDELTDEMSPHGR